MPGAARVGKRRCHVNESLLACFGVCALLAAQVHALSPPQHSCGSSAFSAAPSPEATAATCSAELLAAAAQARSVSNAQRMTDQHVGAPATSQAPSGSSAPSSAASSGGVHDAAATSANRSAAGAASQQLSRQQPLSQQARQTQHAQHAQQTQQGAAIPRRSMQQRKSAEQTLAEITAENDWKNSLALWSLPPAVVSAMPRVVRSWVRNYLMCVGLFVGIAAVWAYYIYYAFGAVLFKGKLRPTPSAMTAQVRVWFGAIPLYAVMPAGIEWAAEAGWTRAYSRVGDVGIISHVLYFTVFMAAVEAGVWAVHKWLHTQAFYRALHHVHHIYNKQGALSPFAGLAFHPLDGIMQAAPYCIALLVIPTHFMTFELLLLATGIWTTNIHDTVDGKVAPLLGAGYHTLHHITYRHNFGHYTTYMDWLMGTLLSPDQYERQHNKAKAVGTDQPIDQKALVT